MSFTYENHGTNTFLTYEINQNQELDTMSLGMLTNNKIPGFASASFAQMDTTRYIKYNVTGKIPVSKLFNGPVNKKRLLGVLSGVVEAMLSAEDYMIDPQTILLNQEYIFADVTNFETVMICLPVIQEGDNNFDLAMFFRNLIFRTMFDQTENCDHVTQILNFINRSPVLVLEDFRALLDQLNKSGAAAQRPQALVADKPQQGQNVVPAGGQVKVQPAVNVQQGQTGGVHGGQQVNPISKFEPNYQNQVPPTNPPVQVPPVQNQVPVQNQIPGQGNVNQRSVEKPKSGFLDKLFGKNSGQATGDKNAKKKEKIPFGGSKTEPANNRKNVNIPGQPGLNIPPANGGRPPINPMPGNQVQQAAPADRVNAPPVQQPAPAVTPQKQEVKRNDPPAHDQIVFPGTVVLGSEIQGTTVLEAAPEAAPAAAYLIRKRTGEKIVLSKPTFKIGREPTYVDYAVTNNSNVSRSHAMVINRNGEYFIEDTNSKNHTYVNGTVIQTGTSVRIDHGAKISLGNEEFEFKMY